MLRVGLNFGKYSRSDRIKSEKRKRVKVCLTEPSGYMSEGTCRVLVHPSQFFPLKIPPDNFTNC